MSDLANSRPAIKRQVHGLCVAATVAVAGTLLFLNLDGYQKHLFGSGALNILGEPPIINWAHGWPCVCVIRQSTYPLTGKWQSANSFLGPGGYYSRWPLDDAPVSFFSLSALLIDSAILSVLTLGTGYAVQRLIGRPFGLKWLFAATAVAGLGCAALVSPRMWPTVQRAFAPDSTSATKVRCAVYLLLFAISLVATSLAGYSISDIAGRAYLKFGPTRRSNPRNLRTPEF
jgi:hypothetical protein